MNFKSSISSFPRVLLWLSFALSIGVLLRYLYFAPYGLDFTDEGFYFNWYKYPELAPATATFFGFVYAIPYRLLGENIPALRVFNILTVLAVGAWCASQPFEKIKGVKSWLGGSVMTALFIFSLSTLSLIGLGSWTSPNYNHLAFIGCLLVTGALIKSGPLDESPQVSSFWFGLPLIGGIVAASLSKPTTGCLLALIGLGYAFFLQSSSRRRMILCLFFSLFLTVCISILFAGSPSQLFSKVTLGMEWASLLGSGHNLEGLVISIVKLFYPWYLPLLFLPWAFVVQVSIVICFFSHQVRRWLVAKQLSIALIFFLSWHTFVDHRSLLPGPLVSIGSIWFAVLPLSFLITYVVCKGSNSVNSEPAYSVIRFPGLSRLLLILLVPFGYAFGTNTVLWAKIFSASIVFVCVSALFIAQLPSGSIRRAFNAFLLCVAIGEFLLLPAHSQFYLEPYRQPQSLLLNKSLTRVGPASHLILSEEYSRYINNARSALKQHGFKPGFPLLDLTGQSPGLIYAVDGRPIGKPWMIGGYEGSNALARAVIAKIPCNDLHSSWLIIERRGPRSLDLSILDDFQIAVSDQSKYELVAHLVTPKGAGGYEEERHQYIYKPLDEQGSGSKCTL